MFIRSFDLNGRKGKVLYLEERIEVLLNGCLKLPLEKIHVVLGRSIF